MREAFLFLIYIYNYNTPIFKNSYINQVMNEISTIWIVWYMIVLRQIWNRLVEEMNKLPGKESGSRLNVEVKEQSDDVSNGMSPSPGQGGATKPPQSTAVHCLCSPTTHAGSFRCRHHRNSSASV